MEQGFEINFYAKVSFIKKISEKLVVFNLSAFHFGWVNIKGRAFNENVDKIMSLPEDAWITGNGNLTLNEWTNNKTGVINKDLELTVKNFTKTEKPAYKDKANKTTYKPKYNKPNEEKIKTKAEEYNFDDEDLPF